jgi:hypothetical protein
VEAFRTRFRDRRPRYSPAIWQRIAFLRSAIRAQFHVAQPRAQRLRVHLAAGLQGGRTVPLREQLAEGSFKLAVGAPIALPASGSVRLRGRHLRHLPYLLREGKVMMRRSSAVEANELAAGYIPTANPFPPQIRSLWTATDESKWRGMSPLGKRARHGQLPRGVSLAQSYEGLPEEAFGIAWSADGALLAAAGGYSEREGTGAGEIVLWTVATGQRQDLHRPAVPSNVLGLAWHPVRSVLASGSVNGDIRIWDLGPNGLHVVEGPPEGADIRHLRVRGLAWSPDGSMLAVGGEDVGGGVLEIRDARTLKLLGETRYPSLSNSPCWSPDGKLVVTPSTGGGVYVHRSRDLRLIRTFNPRDEWVSYVDISPDSRFAAIAPTTEVVRVWELGTGKEIAVLENLKGSAGCVKFSPNGNLLAAQTGDLVELWRCRDWERVAVIPLGEGRRIGGLAFHPSRPLLAIKDNDSRRIHSCAIDYGLIEGAGVRHDSRRYVNAKVVLLGDTGVGKSGLGLVLSGQEYEPTDSSHGRRVWTFDSREVEVPGGGRQTREVLLWDLAGQPGYRLVHQLHLNEITVALLVFDSRSETDPFSGVKHWVRALEQARSLEETTVPLHSYLVAARADRGGVAVSRERVQAMIEKFRLDGFFETSAKEGWQITELKSSIEAAIDWDALPMVSSSVLFDSIKQFLLEEKKQGRVLCTADDLFRGFLRTQPDDTDHNTLRVSFETCVGRVESRDLIRRLHFGGLVLLQPELLDGYASALVQAAKSEPDGLGFIREADALSGRFRLAAEERIPDPAQEKLLLIATVEELLRHEIALKEATDQGVDLVFPSQLTRERPHAVNIPGRKATFAFQGPLESIYASLAVRLAHSSLFRRETMWQNAASYTAAAGGTCGIHLRELEEGRGELTLFYNAQAGDAVRAQFETYVARHLEQRALPGSVHHRVIRSCVACGYVLPEDLIQRWLRRGKHVTPCPACEETVFSLRDEPLAAAGAVVSEMDRNADEQRDRNVAATRLKGKIETSDYDVFLCHNSRDKKEVMAIGERLKERGILPWLDVWEIRPGVRWQKELRRVIKSVKTAAVFIGPSGASPWQELEVESLLGEFAKRNKPMIPVILEGRVGNPRLPAFFSLWHMIDMRNPSPDPFEQLVWGITGEKNDPTI